MPLRRLTPAYRALLLVMVALALAVRAAIPAGWMPMTGADGGVGLVLCPGADATMAGMAMRGAAARDAMGHDRHRDPAAPALGHDCPFAVAALAVDLAGPIALPAARPVVATRLLARIPAMLPGRGLAAPPPPATGPPALA